MKRIILSILPAALVTITMVMAFTSAAGGAGIQSASDMFLLSFGKGKTQIKLYSDYFCGACRALEPGMEHSIADLVKRNAATVTFVDVPMHKNSAMYASYFLYILNEKKDIQRALKARSVLFEAARLGISDKDKLEQFLLKKGFKFRKFDAKSLFSVLQGYLKDDMIRATPTSVVSRNGKKEFSEGAEAIMGALRSVASSVYN